MAKKAEQSRNEQHSPDSLVRDRSTGICQFLPPDVRLRYEVITRDARYQHFVRIAPRIARCLDYFRIKFDGTLVHDRLLAYYVFIGVIDEALDSGNLHIGKSVLDHFDRPVWHLAEHTDPSNLKLVTEVLKSHTTNENRGLISMRLAELYREVVREQAATSINAYIQHRITIGARTAELSYLLIEDLLRGETDALCRLMKQVGKVGCLVDSVIDLNIDWRLGLLSFKPLPIDRLKVTTRALCEGARTLLQHPRLTILFGRAIADNIRDRFRAGRVQSPLLASERKDEIPGVT